MKKGMELDRELQELLDSSKTIEELLKESEGLDTLDLDKDPEFIADFMKGMLIEDILKAMKENDISKTQLAGKLGKSRQYVTRILNETANFTLKSIAEITCALDMQVQARIYRQDEVLNIVKKTFKVEFKISTLEQQTEVDVDEDYISVLPRHKSSVDYDEIIKQYKMVG